MAGRRRRRDSNREISIHRNTANFSKSTVQIQHVEEESSSSKSSFKEKCSHLAKKQRAKFYILRRCITLLVCWHERKDPLD